MNIGLDVDLMKIYKKEQIPEFESGRSKIEEILGKIRVQKLAARGFIRPASKKEMKWDMPPKFPGKPLSEYVKEIKG